MTNLQSSEVFSKADCMHAAAAPTRGACEEGSKSDARSPAVSHSLRASLRAFWDANPTAELSRSQIATKFHRSIKTVDIALTLMRKAGELEPVHAWRRPSNTTKGNQ